MNALWFVIAALAVYRISHLLALEEGPFEAFATLRGRFDPDQRTWLGRGLNCPLCVSYWVGWLGGLALVPIMQLDFVGYVLVSLALSGAASALYQKVG